ncbi:hypothetical protein FXF51_02310 [Nonomuraea sp. PA05]|uniref:hypothetical protein n=1 Tax=Nonomuraea sp. PA05 TaxID=2604466 RepID=UPI0011D901B5|nr:hypothetical protein [Nonomuraea sp. PA05]TYB71287.1 hypothetical protein FXF51_02310 [Nonomuraea sp. PA05]
MNTVLAAIVTIALFVPVAIYFFSVIGREREQPEPQRQEAPQVEEGGTAVAVTVNRPESGRTTNVALTWIKQVINGGRDKPAIEPPPPPPPKDDVGPEWTPPADLDDLPDLRDFDVQVEVNRPAPDTTSPPENPPAAEAVAIERGLLDRVRDWLGSAGDAPPPPIKPVRPDPDWLDITADPRRLPEPRLPGLPASDAPAMPEVQVERLPDVATIGTGEPTAPPPPALPPADSVVEIEPVEVIAPIELQGVDDVDLVPTGRRTMARVPTPHGIQAAMRTIGYTILYTWLKAFRKANGDDLGNAQRMHRMALGHAQRARVKLAIASNLLLAVQADRLGPHVIRNCTATWMHAHREASAAYNVAIYTGELVRASGGVPLSIKAAMKALERDHGGMAAAARKMTVEPVRDMGWYRR